MRSFLSSIFAGFATTFLTGAAFFAAAFFAGAAFFATTFLAATFLAGAFFAAGFAAVLPALALFLSALNTATIVLWLFLRTARR